MDTHRNSGQRRYPAPRRLYAAGLTDVILPERNRGDLDEIPEDVRSRVSFHPVITVGEVLERALEPAREVAHVS